MQPCKLCEAVPLTGSLSCWGILLGAIAMFSMLLGFFAWNTGLRMGGIAKIGQLQLLQTFFTLGIAAVVIGERITLETIAFAVAVLIVVLVGRKAQVAR